MDREFMKFFFGCLGQFLFGMFVLWMLLVAAAWILEGVRWIVTP